MRPSASVSTAPSPEAMNRGVPPTARKARTGELTPPGVTASARRSSASEAGASEGYAAGAPGVVGSPVLMGSLSQADLSGLRPP